MGMNGCIEEVVQVFGSCAVSGGAITSCAIAKTTVVVAGGDDAGTGAAYTSAKLGIPTVLFLSNPRDLGGDITSFYNDGIGMDARRDWNIAGGLNAELEAFKSNVGNHGHSPGVVFSYLNSLLRSPPISDNLSILSGWLPAPGSGELGSEGAVKAMSFVHENGSVCRIEADFVIEGTPEGYVSQAFNLPLVFGREARHPSSDPTMNLEAFAGNKLFGKASAPNTSVQVMGYAPPEPSWSDFETPDNSHISMGASPILATQQYATSNSKTAAWVLSTPPTNYSSYTYQHLWSLDSFRHAWPDGEGVYRFEGSEHVWSLPGWYLVDNGQHYLTKRDDIWSWKKFVEKRAFSYAVGAMYYLQQNTSDGLQWGFDNKSYPNGTACYYLADFGTKTFGNNTGNVPIACRLYHRVLARTPSWTPIGGGMILNSNSSACVVKTYFEPEALAMPLYGADFHAILGDDGSVPDGAGPEGFLRLQNPGPSCGNFHGLHRRILEPDLSITPSNIPNWSAPIFFPPNPPKTITNILLPGTPRTTFMVQAGARIGCYAQALGAAAAALIKATIVQNATNTSTASTSLAQWILASEANVGFNYLQDVSYASDLHNFSFAQLPGTFAIPPQQLNGDFIPDPITSSDFSSMMQTYSKLLLNQTLSNVFTPYELASRSSLVQALDSIVPNSSAQIITTPIPDPSAPVRVWQLREIITRHVLFQRQTLQYTKLLKFSF